MNNNTIILDSINIIDQINDAIQSLVLLAQCSDNIDAKHVGNVLAILHENLHEEYQVLLLNLKTSEVSLKVVK